MTGKHLDATTRPQCTCGRVTVGEDVETYPLSEHSTLCRQVEEAADRLGVDYDSFAKEYFW